MKTSNSVKTLLGVFFYAFYIIGNAISYNVKNKDAQKNCKAIFRVDKSYTLLARP